MSASTTNTTAYDVVNWVAGDVITQTKIQNISDAVANATNEIEGAQSRSNTVISGSLGERLNKMIVASNSSSDIDDETMIWLNTSTETYSIPTWDDFDALVLRQETQPSTTDYPEAANKIWLNTSSESEIEIPTTEELDSLCDTIANEFSSSSTYFVGDYVYYTTTDSDGNTIRTLYECTTDITTAGAWDESYWTEVILGDELTELNDGLTELKSDIINSNEIYFTSRITSKYYGMTFKYESDNTVTINGTATSNIYIGFNTTPNGTSAPSSYTAILSGSEYTLFRTVISGSATTSSGGSTNGYFRYYEGNSSAINITTGSNVTFSADSDLCYYIPSGATYTDFKIFFSMVEGSTAGLAYPGFYHTYDAIQDEEIEELTEDVEDINDDLEDIRVMLYNSGIELERIDFDTYGVSSAVICDYINSTSITNLTSSDAIVTQSNWYYLQYPCEEGDVFVISGNSGKYSSSWASVSSNPYYRVRAYYFVNSSGTVISTCDATVTANYLEVTAPTDTAYIIINNRYTHDHQGSYIRTLVESEIPDYYFDDYSTTDSTPYITQRMQTALNYADTITSGDMFAFITDMHTAWLNTANAVVPTKKQGHQSVPLLNYLREHMGLRFIINGGDMLLDSYYASTTSQIFKIMELARSQLDPVFDDMYFCIGNHDWVPAGSTSSDRARLGIGSIYNTYLRDKEQRTVSMSRLGDMELYNKTYAIRYFLMGATANSGIDDVSLYWFARRLQEINAGDTIVVALHAIGSTVNVENESDSTQHSIYLNQSTGFGYLSDIITGALECSSSVYVDSTSINIEDYSNFSGDFACVLTGHTHRDCTSGFLEIDNKVPIIMTTCDRIPNYQYKWTDGYTSDYTITSSDAGYRVAGTVTEQAFDIVNLDTANHIIYCTRIGGWDTGESTGDRVFYYTPQSS